MTNNKLDSLTQEELKEILDFDPATGVFRWRISHSGVRLGKIAGSKTSSGYYRVKIKYQAYPVHRLAWLYVYGKWPADQIDHIDGDKLNNRIANLRECTQAENLQNLAPSKLNTSGYTGVRYAPRQKKWKATIKVNTKGIHLGYFETKESAYEAYLKAKREHHKFQPVPRHICGACTG
jgi:hypothetical protein